VNDRRPVAALLAALLAAGGLAACTSSSPSPSAAPSATATSPTPSASPAAPSEGLIGPSASRALAKLCPSRSFGGTRAPAEGSAPAIVSRIEGQVEGIRGLEFTRRVPVDAVTHDELVRGLEQTFDAAYPTAFLRRRSLAWSTIGAIPPGTQIRQQLEAFAGSQVIGYYDEVSKYLVFIGSDDPAPVELVTLAHELTHALDDQHFGLMRLDELAGDCQEEAYEATLALAEGDATFVMLAYAQRYLSLEEQVGLASQSGSLPGGIAPFVVRLQTWPYTAGLTFVQRLTADGGERAVDAAFRRLPVSTEQIIDPSAYPDDRPTTVDLPQLAPALGRGWTDLDVQPAGVAWLSILLGLRLDQDRASAAVRGWEGGLYRAWTDGADVAVVLRTTWEDAAAGSRFRDAMNDWLTDAGGSAEVEPASGNEVTVLFASSPQTLEALRLAS
jgi:hypothetical protein